MPLFWPTSCVGFSLQKNGTQSIDLDDTRIAVQKSFEAWSEVPCPDVGGKFSTMTFSELGDVDCHKSQYNTDGSNVNVVLFQDNDWTYKGIDGTLAKTAVTYDDRTGEIFDADIEVNAAFNNLNLDRYASRLRFAVDPDARSGPLHRDRAQPRSGGDDVRDVRAGHVHRAAAGEGRRRGGLRDLPSWAYGRVRHDPARRIRRLVRRSDEERLRDDRRAGLARQRRAARRRAVRRDRAPRAPTTRPPRAARVVALLREVRFPSARRFARTAAAGRPASPAPRWFGAA